MFSIWMLIKVLHILAGAFWIGGAAMIAAFLLPAAKRTGPSAGVFMGHLMGGLKLPLAMNLASWTTLLMGTLLYWRFTGGFKQWSLYWPGGIGLLTGVISGIIAFLWGSFIQAPNAKKLGALLAQMQQSPSPELGAKVQVMQKKIYLGAWVGVLFLVLSQIGMTLLH